MVFAWGTQMRENAFTYLRDFTVLIHDSQFFLAFSKIYDWSIAAWGRYRKTKGRKKWTGR